MPRGLRIEYKGAVYHLMSRGDRWEAIFRDSADRERLLQSLGEASGMTGWRGGGVAGGSVSIRSFFRAGPAFAIVIRCGLVVTSACRRLRNTAYDFSSVRNSLSEMW